MKTKLEIIAFDAQSCKTIAKSKADRIELCENAQVGGTTPAQALIHFARQTTTKELFVMVRPRGGDFLYNVDEFSLMKETIQLCKQEMCDGVVLGILTKNGKVDKKKTAELVQLATPMTVTFHRAFDRTSDPKKSLFDIIDVGCSRILTSGQKQTAWEGKELIKQLVKWATNKIIIMPGSGIHAQNIAQLKQETAATEFHSSAKMWVQSKMIYKNSTLGSSEDNYIGVDEVAVNQMAKLIH